MPEITAPGGHGSIDPLLQSYDKNVASGQMLLPCDFKMRFVGYDSLELLVQTAQSPLIARDKIETFGQSGVKFWQWGKPQLAGELAATVKEVVSGEVFTALRGIVKSAEYVTIELELAANSAVATPESHKFLLEDCLITADGGDLDVSNVTGILTVPLQITYNRFVP